MFVVDSKGICKKFPDHVARLLEPNFLRWASSAESKDATISSLQGSSSGIDAPGARPSITFAKPNFMGRSKKSSSIPGTGEPNWVRRMLFSLVILLGLSGAAYVIDLIATRDRNRPHHYPVHIHVPVHAGPGSAMEQAPINVSRPPVRLGPAMERPINVPRSLVRSALKPIFRFR